MIHASIGHEAAIEAWTQTRAETRRRLAGALTLGTFYVLTSLAVGAFLIHGLAEAVDDSTYLEGWESYELQVTWTGGVIIGYGLIAVFTVIGYALAMLLIKGWLIAPLSATVWHIPWIGPTMRSVALGELCQSIYESVLETQTYADALASASKAVSNKFLARWLSRASELLDSGASLATLLKSAPMQDQPITAVSALVGKPLSETRTIELWRQAASDCHLLAQSRVNRAVQFVSMTCLLISVLFASFAMLMSVFLMQLILRGWYFLWF